MRNRRRLDHSIVFTVSYPPHASHGSFGLVYICYYRTGRLGAAGQSQSIIKKTTPRFNPSSWVVRNADALLSLEFARTSLNHSTPMPNVKGGGGQIDTGAAAHEQGSSRRGQEGGLV